MHTKKDILMRMKMYERLLLTYINKYHRLDFSVLTSELKMADWQIAQIVSSLKENGFVRMENQRYEVSEQGQEWIFPMWNDWSVYYQEEEWEKTSEFVWDYLYIPENMI